MANSIVTDEGCVIARCGQSLRRPQVAKGLRCSGVAVCMTLLMRCLQCFVAVGWVAGRAYTGGYLSGVI